MPGPQTARAAGFSFGAAARQHARDETNYGTDFSRLPGGISNGRARVFSAAIGVYKKGDNEGKRFVRLAATVLKPAKFVETIKEFKKGGEFGIKGRAVVVGHVDRDLDGLQTSQMYSIEADDRRGTAEENTAFMLNELRRTMGDDSFTAPLEQCKTDEQSWKVLEALLAKIKEEKPIIKFSTSDLDPTEKNPKSMAFENWHGRAPADDLIPAAAPANGFHAGGAATASAATAGMADATPAAMPFDETANEQLQDAAELPADDDWDGWLERYNATEGEEQNEAVDKLTAIATAAGLEEAAIQDAPDWDAVRVMMDEVAAGAADAPEEPAEEAPPEPTKGDVMYATLPKDPKDAKKGRAKVAVLIETVNKKAATVTGKNNATKKPIVGKDGKALAIPFAELSVD